MPVRRRVEPHGLGDDVLGVRQPRQIGHGGARAPSDRAQLLGEARVDLRVLRQQVPGPRERHRGGLVPRHEEGHDLVADLPVGHPAPVVGILRVQEHGEQVAAVLAAPPARRDHAVDDLVEAADRPARPAGWPASAPRPGGRSTLPSRAPKSSMRTFRRGADRVGLVGDVGVEERLGDDGLGQRHHLGVNVEDVRRPPAGQPPRGVAVIMTSP